MLGIGDVRDYIAGLGLAANTNVYCGKLDDKKDKSIGIYNSSRQRPVQMAIGGIKNSSYRVKSVSVLVHWNKSVRDTEKAAEQLYNMLRDTKRVMPVQYVQKILGHKSLNTTMIYCNLDEDNIKMEHRRVA